MNRLCLSTPCTYIHARQANQELFFLYGDWKNFSEHKSLVVYLQGWSDEFICMLDPAWGRVALVCQIEQLPDPTYDFITV
jgi:hypothetical protein